MAYPDGGNPDTTPMMPPIKGRLTLLDALRGFTMLCFLAFPPHWVQSSLFSSPLPS